MRQTLRAVVAALRFSPTHVLVALLTAGTICPALALADVLLHDRTGDPVGASQTTPSVAVTYNQIVHVSYVVTLWDQLVGSVREFNVSLAQAPLGSGPVNDVNVPPAPAGFLWYGDPIVRASTVTTDGTFFIFGQIRSLGASPFTYGIGFLRGKAQAGATVSWETPQVLETFGTNIINQRYVGVLAMDVHPGTNVVHIGYMNTKPAFGTPKSLWHRSSPNGGVTWNAPAMVGNDSTSESGVDLQCGPDSGQVTFFFYTTAGSISTLHCRRSTDFGVTLSPTEDVWTYTGTGQSTPFGLSGSLRMTTEIDRTGNPSPFAPELYTIVPDEMDHLAYTFPSTTTAPSTAEVEPNGSAAQAMLVPSSGHVLRGAITAVADSDWFAFDLTAGAAVEVLSDSNSASFTPRYVWLGPDGRSSLTVGGTRFGFVAPIPGRYYLMVITRSGTGIYRARTVGGSVSTGARDQHDVFLSSSAPAEPWSPPRNASAAAFLPVGLDESGPSLCSNLDGWLYAAWTEWDPVSVTSRRIMRRSFDHGFTWQDRVELNTSPSNWLNASVPGSGTGFTIFPFAAATTDGTDIHEVWVDARNGDPDLYGSTISRRMVVTGIVPSALTVARGQSVHVNVNTQNVDPYFGWDALLEGSSSRGWALQVLGGSLSPGQTTGLDYTFVVPDTAAYGTVTVQVTVKGYLFPNTTYDHGSLTLTISPLAGVDDGPARLALAPLAPNPGFGEAHVGFSLSRPGHARAAVFAIDGRRVRTLVDAGLAAGAHSYSWDGRDDAGGLVAPGAYVVRLEAEERVLSRRLAWLR